MNTIIRIIVFSIILALSYYSFAAYMSNCDQPIEYSVGQIDAQFGIPAADFQKILEDTEQVWETPLGMNFFQYNPNAKLKVNLVYDERQQRTQEEQASRAEISDQQRTYRTMVKQYEADLAAHQEQNALYESDLAAYDARTQKYNEQVEYWNNNGGAPAKEYSQLQQEKIALQKELKKLDATRDQLNTNIAALHAQADAINVAARNLNLDVDAYNGKFGASREFDQGTYTGDAINIYQYTGIDDLRLVIAHEFGHALKLDHTDDPQSIMYYLMDQQNIKNLHLSDADLAAVKRVCKIRN